jgi:hypothetical protein
MYQFEDEWTDALDTPLPENVIGLSKSHTTRFREFRSEKLDSYNTDINKLVIRLEKLINGLTADPVKVRNINYKVPNLNLINLSRDFSPTEKISRAVRSSMDGRHAGKLVPYLRWQLQHHQKKTPLPVVRSHRLQQMLLFPLFERRLELD